MIMLIMEALLRHPEFRPRNRNWIKTAERDRLLAEACATAIADHLERCGIVCSKRPPLRPHSAGE